MKSSFLRITSLLFPAIEKMHHIQSDGAGPLSFQLLFEENKEKYSIRLCMIRLEVVESILCCSSPVIADYGIVGI